MLLGLREGKGEQHRSRRHADVLATSDHESDGRAHQVIVARVHAPKVLTGARVERQEVAIFVAGEDESARGRKRSRPGRANVAEIPFGFAREWIERLKQSPLFFLSRASERAAP